MHLRLSAINISVLHAPELKHHNGAEKGSCQVYAHKKPNFQEDIMRKVLYFFWKISMSEYVFEMPVH